MPSCPSRKAVPAAVTASWIGPRTRRGLRRERLDDDMVLVPPADARDRPDLVEGHPAGERHLKAGAPLGSGHGSFGSKPEAHQKRQDNTGIARAGADGEETAFDHDRIRDVPAVRAPVAICDPIFG